MTFEKKTLIAVAIEGMFEPEQNAKFAWNYYSVGKNQHVLLYGVEKRQENDAEQALLYSLQIRSPFRKIFVVQESVLIENLVPTIGWLPQWEQTFTNLNKNEIGVSLELVRIYRRVFEIQPRRKGTITQFLLGSKKAQPARIRGLKKKYSPMVGRKKELANLLEVIEQSFEDQGQIASVIGEAGLGKTRLKHELIQELTAKKIKTYEGYFSLNVDQSYAGFRQLAQQVLDQNLDTFSSWDLNDSESAFLRYFLHPEEKNSIVNDLNEEELTQGILNSVQKLFFNAGKHPMVMILDDFHWVDEKSVQLMDYLAQSLEKTKIAFFLFHRPSIAVSFKKRLNYHQIKLSPLAQTETKELVKNVLKLDYVADRAMETLSTLSLGNPLYVEEVLRELISQKKIEVDKEQDLIRLIQVNFPEGSIPTNIQSLIVSRFDVLPKEAREILQWTCAFGFREDHDDFELLLQTLEYSADSFHLLFEQVYLEEASMFPTHKYKFSHDLLYETIRQSIPDHDWAFKNQKIAVFLYELYRNEMINHSDRVAEFFLKGRMDESSFEPIFSAAKIALEQRRYSSAVKYFDESYQLYIRYQVPVDRIELLGKYLEALFAAGKKDKFKSIIQTWENSGFSSSVEEAKFYSLYLEYLNTYREGQKLFEVSRKAIQKLKDSGLDNEITRFEVFYCQALFFLSKYDELVHKGLTLLRKLNKVPDADDMKINLYYTLGSALQYTGHADTSSYYILIAKNAADKTNNFRQKILIHKRIGSLATTQGYYKEAVRIWSDLIYDCEQNGFLTEKYLFMNNVILNNINLGNYRAVIDDAKHINSSNKNDWDNHYTKLLTCNAFLSMGAFEETKQIYFDYRFFPEKDFLIKSHKFYFIGNYHFQRQDFLRAELNYKRARNIFEKNKQTKYIMDMDLHILCCRVLQKTVNPKDASKEFDWITSHDSMRKYYYLWNTQMLSFFLTRNGCKLKFKPSEAIDPNSCNVAYLRMRMFVEKIKWLRSIGKDIEAEKVRDQYIKHRQEMSFYVPDEYKESYLNHPFYQV